MNLTALSLLELFPLGYLLREVILCLELHEAHVVRVLDLRADAYLGKHSENVLGCHYSTRVFQTALTTRGRCFFVDDYQILTFAYSSLQERWKA